MNNKILNNIAKSQVSTKSPLRFNHLISMLFHNISIDQLTDHIYTNLLVKNNNVKYTFTGNQKNLNIKYIFKDIVLFKMDIIVYNYRKFNQYFKVIIHDFYFNGRKKIEHVFSHKGDLSRYYFDNYLTLSKLRSNSFSWTSGVNSKDRRIPCVLDKNNPIIIHKKNFKGDKKFIINRFNNYFKDQIKEYIKFEIINYHNSKIKRYD